MSRRTDRTTSRHDELQWWRQRVAELERERAQAAEQHYRVLFEHTPSMYFALLPDGTVLSVNQYGAKHLGYVPEELIGRSILSLYERADHPTVLSQWATCADNPTRIFEWEVGKIRRDGRPLRVKERAQTVPDGKGGLMILVVCEDITAQHQAETQRRQTEESLRELNLALSHAMPGIARLDLEGRFVIINDFYAAQLGREAAELIGQPWQLTVHPEDRARTERAYEQLCLTGQAEFDALAVRKDGAVFHMQMLLVRINDAAGRMIGHHSFMRNISRRKQAEQELRMIKERLQHLITSSPAVVYACKPCGDFGTTYISDNVFERLGYTPQEFVEDSGFWAVHIHPDDRTRVLNETTNLLRDGYHETDYRFRHKDGTYRWIHDRLRLVRDEIGNPLEFVGSWIDVTERKQVEADLRASEERFAKAFRSSPYPIGITNLKTGACIDINDAALAAFGYTREELIGRTTVTLGIWPDQDARQRFIERVIAHGSVRNIEVGLKTRTGDVRHFLASSELIELNGTQCLVTIGSDVTERKRAEEALRASEQQLQRFVAEAPVGLVIMNSQRQLISANKAFCELTGYAEDEVLCRTSDFYTHPDDFAANRVVTDEFYQGHRSKYTFEKRYIRKGGDVIWVSVTATRIDLPNHQGPLLLASVQNITEQKEAEGALRRSHAFLRQVIDIDPNFIFAKDRDGRFTLVNQAVADAYGTTVEGLIGKTDADFNPNREEVEFFRKMDLEVLDTRSERFIPEEMVTDASGRTRWLQTVKRPIIDEQGRATQVLGAATDISDRKRTEEQRERLSQDLHDNLLQSLYAVGMQLEASRLASVLSSKQSKAYVAQAIDQLNHLVQDVRNFIASLKHRAVPRQDLGRALHQLVASLSFAESSAPQLEIETAAVAAIRPDHSDHVLNIAREALSNSLRHAHAGSRWLRFSRTDSAVRMVIADDGLGFHPSKNHREGHGLGHMAERAKLIGARLHVESAPGRGTSITVEVPLGRGGADV